MFVFSGCSVPALLRRCWPSPSCSLGLGEQGQSRVDLSAGSVLMLGGSRGVKLNVEGDGRGAL